MAPLPPPETEQGILLSLAFVKGSPFLREAMPGSFAQPLTQIPELPPTSPKPNNKHETYSRAYSRFRKLGTDILREAILAYIEDPDFGFGHDYIIQNYPESRR